MATAYVSLKRVQGSFPDGRPLPLANSIPHAKEALSFTTTHGTTTIAAPTDDGWRHLVWRVVLSDPAYIAFGADPAATTTDEYMTAGTVEYFAVSGPGEKFSAEALA